jgi:hypothetical protein
VFISMRSAASCCQPLQASALPRGARTEVRARIVESGEPGGTEKASLAF